MNSKKCVQLYKQGECADTPAGIKKDSFHSMIRKWGKLEEFHGSKVLKHTKNIKWNSDEELAMVSKVLAGNSIYSVATENGINDGQLYT